MDTLYWTCLVVGGVSVLAAIFGGGDTDTDVDVDVDADVDVDVDIDADVGWVDLFSLRTVLLFAAFFGLSGVLLPLAGVGETTRAVLSLVTGLGIGIVGNFVIKRVGYDHVSSTVTAEDLAGSTAKVLIPFDHTDKGKITLISKGRRVQLMACSYGGTQERFGAGEEVVVVRVKDAVAEVLKPT